MFTRAIPLLVLATVALAPSAHTADGAAHVTCKGAISWSAARSAVGRTVTVKGPVADTYYARSSNGSPTFLNLGQR